MNELQKEYFERAQKEREEAEAAEEANWHLHSLQKWDIPMLRSSAVLLIGVMER